jgi:jumonji domain-containing protein 7
MWTASPETVETLIEDVESLWIGHSNDGIPVYETLPNPDDFFRQHVAVNRPCVIRRQGTIGSLDNLHAAKSSDLSLQVDVTPDGHGDCLRQVQFKDSTEPVSCFVKPMECRMKWNEFRHALEKKASTVPNDTESKSQPIHNRVFTTCESQEVSGHDIPPPQHAVMYYSRQNDCLRTELQPLWQTHLHNFSKPLLQWAAQVFQQETPEAVNLWMGNADAVSSMHKDPYENVYHVLQGTKTFVLVPPAYAPMLQEKSVPSGHFQWDDKTDQWKVQLDINAETGQVETVPWITVDVTKKEPSSSRIPYRVVRVEAGDVLYLPALWFHRVSQQGAPATIAINYWFDMNFASPLWVYFNFMQQLQTNS